MTNDWKLIRFLACAIVACLLLLAAVVVANGAEPPTPKFTPSPSFAPIPKFIEIPVTAEVSKKEPVKKVIKKVWGIVGYSRACPTCPLTPQYGWIDEEEVSDNEKPEPTVAEAASRLSKGGLSREEEKKMAEIIDRPAMEGVAKGKWCPGSCQMLCRIPSHGTHWEWDDPSDQGKEPPAWGSWEENGQSTGYEPDRRFRLFRGFRR